MKKKLFGLFAAFLVCASLGVVTACNNNGDSSSSSSSSTTDSSESSTADSSNDSSLTGDEMMCRVTVKSEGGMLLSGVTVSVYDADDELVKELDTGANGAATLFLEEGEYSVRLKNVPLGYYQTSFNHKLSPEGVEATIKLGIELVDEEDRAGHVYKVGDVMHDFSLQTIDNKTLTLSDLLEEKDMVFLNFWYATCNPCLTEMPWMKNAYNDERYTGKFEIIAIHSNMHDLETAKAFVASTDWNFPVSHVNLTDLASYFVIGGYPTTVIIDRYGVVALCETGRLENQSECNNLIAKYLKTDYTQDFTNGGAGAGGDEGGDSSLPTVTVADPTNEELNNALSTNGLEYSLDENEYVWPFIPTEVDGRDCIYASNGPVLGVDAHYTSSVLSVKVNVPETNFENYVFTFDYKISSEYDADFFYVLVDGVIVQKYSGPDMIPNGNGELYVPAEWKTSYAYVPVKAGEHTLSFVYQKDSAISDGDDTVYIDNLRFEPLGEGSTYVYRNAATERLSDADGFKTANDEKDTEPRFGKYAKVYFNAEDGYYHVYNENGPLLLANLMDTSTNWSKYPIWNYLAVGNYLEYTDGGEILNLKADVESFANAELHSDNGYIPVDQDLAALLQFITNRFGSGYENEWLEICCYYDAYGCEQMANPCEGVSFRYATKLPTIQAEGGEVRAVVDIQKLINPRGYKYAFTPTLSGVYLISSDRTIAKDPNFLDPIAWFTSADLNYDNEGAVIFQHSADVGIDFSFRVRLTAGKTYYVAAADHDPSFIGDKYELVVKLLSTSSEALTEFTECAVQPYVNVLDGNGNPTWQAEARGIRYGVDENGDVRVLRADGSFASYIYLSVLDSTYFMNNTMKDVIEGKIAEYGTKAFDFSQLTIDTNGDGNPDTEVLDQNGNAYGDYLETMKAYLSEALANEGELHGYVKVTAELQQLLRLFTMKVHGEEIIESWQCLCYYYKEI